MNESRPQTRQSNLSATSAIVRANRSNKHREEQKSREVDQLIQQLNPHAVPVTKSNMQAVFAVQQTYTVQVVVGEELRDAFNVSGSVLAQQQQLDPMLMGSSSSTSRMRSKLQRLMHSSSLFSASNTTTTTANLNRSLPVVRGVTHADELVGSPARLARSRERSAHTMSERPVQLLLELPTTATTEDAIRTAFERWLTLRSEAGMRTDVADHSCYQGSSLNEIRQIPNAAVFSDNHPIVALYSDLSLFRCHGDGTPSAECKRFRTDVAIPPLFQYLSVSLPELWEDVEERERNASSMVEMASASSPSHRAAANRMATTGQHSKLMGLSNGVSSRLTFPEALNKRHLLQRMIKAGAVPPFQLRLDINAQSLELRRCFREERDDRELLIAEEHFERTGWLDKYFALLEADSIRRDEWMRHQAQQRHAIHTAMMENRFLVQQSELIQAEHNQRYLFTVQQWAHEFIESTAFMELERLQFLGLWDVSAAALRKEEDGQWERIFAAGCESFDLIDCEESLHERYNELVGVCAEKLEQEWYWARLEVFHAFTYKVSSERH